MIALKGELYFLQVSLFYIYLCYKDPSLLRRPNLYFVDNELFLLTP